MRKGGKKCGTSPFFAALPHPCINTTKEQKKQSRPGNEAMSSIWALFVCLSIYLYIYPHVKKVSQSSWRHKSWKSTHGTTYLFIAAVIEATVWQQRQKECFHPSMPSVLPQQCGLAHCKKVLSLLLYMSYSVRRCAGTVCSMYMGCVRQAGQSVSVSLTGSSSDWFCCLRLCYTQSHSDGSHVLGNAACSTLACSG